jgi:hypothetical protein
MASKFEGSAKFALAVVMSLLCLAFSAAPSFGGAINVETLADEIPPAANGVCTFREAVLEANSGIPQTAPDCVFTGALGEDTINLPAGRLEIAGPSVFTDDNTGEKGDFDVIITTGHGLTVNGAGRNATFLDGNEKSRLFDVYNQGSSNIGTRRLNLNDLTVTGGSDGGRGGGIRMEEAFSDDTRLVLRNVNVTGNVSGGRGGGIAVGAAIVDAKDTNITENLVVGSTSQAGGGIAAGAGNGGRDFGFDLERVRVSGNRVLTTAGGNPAARSRWGGGIYLNGSASVYGHGRILDSTISDNLIIGADQYDRIAGGGLYILNAEDFSMRNSTVSGNTLQTGNGAFAGSGGGMTYSYSDGGEAGKFNLANVTFAGNDAGPDGQQDTESSAGGLDQVGGKGRIVNSTFTNNRASVATDYTGDGPFTGTVTTNQVLVSGTIFGDPNACGDGFSNDIKTAGDNLEVQDETCRLTDPPGAVATLTLGAGESAVHLVSDATGTFGNNVTVAIVDPGAPDTPLSVVRFSNAITVTAATDNAGVITSTAQDVVTALNANSSAAALITASNPDGSTGSGVVAPVTATNLTGGTPNNPPGVPAVNGDRDNVAAAALDLGPLRDNGGPTRTAAPGPGSIAIDQIPGARCLDTDGTSPLGFDQRGLARTAPCDIGAVEESLCQGRPINKIGSEGDDQLEGGSGDDVITAFGGNDIIRTGGGSDAICAGDGEDVVDTGGGSADDQADGGPGIDELTYESAPNPVVVDLGAGTATGNGTDTVLGFEDLTGSDSDDTLTGTSDANVITPLGGADTVLALAGSDTVLARDGADDDVDCGADTDSAQGDIIGMDTLTNCEDTDEQEQPAGPGPGPGPGPVPTPGPGVTPGTGGKVNRAKKCRKIKNKKKKKKCLKKANRK